MSISASLPNQLPRHLRPRREKVYGDARGPALDRNAKARIFVYARAWNARHRQPGQHRGPITRAMMEVLQALLWKFHNSRDGRCFPSHRTIAEKAECHPDTVLEAIKVLERAEVLTWVHRITRIRTREPDLFGQLVSRWRIIRTSNAYSFRDPLPCHAGQPNSSDPENPGGTLNQEFFLPLEPVRASPQTMSPELQAALARLGNGIADKVEREKALSAP